MKATETEYSSRIIKAGALLNDAKLLLREWNEHLDERENLDRFRSMNLLGKASRTRLEDVLQELRRRYLLHDGTGGALRRFVSEVSNSAAIDRVLYYHAAKADPLIYDFATEFLYPRRMRRERVVTLDETASFLRHAQRRSRTSRSWNEETLIRVAHGLLASTRDFGLLEGSANKSIAEPSLPIEAFLYVAFRLRGSVAGAALVGHRDWRLFLMATADVQGLLGEAARRNLATYEALGQVVRIDLPYAGPEVLVDALVR